MKLDAILAHIRSMRDREGVKRIINAAEARDSALLRIEGEKERARLWAKFEALQLQAGDIVYIHAAPRTVEQRERYQKSNGKWGYRKVGKLVASGQHVALWGKPLEVRMVRARSKLIVVRAPGSTVDHRLSPFTCDKLKLSKTPTPEALANALKREHGNTPPPARRAPKFKPARWAYA